MKCKATGNQLIEFLKRHAALGAASFHMPGHKGGKLYSRLGLANEFQYLPSLDITEIEGADNLFQPEGPLEQLMERYRRLYESKEAYLLVNGSSSGLMAAIWSCVSEGDKVIVGSNCHKSVINGLRIVGANPIYVEPEIEETFRCCGKVSAKAIKEKIDRWPEAKVVILTSPNYYGITSPIEEIAKIVEANNGLLIVDQAHGAHLRWTEPKLAAEVNGAHLVICSTHKTLGSFTQSALLLVMSPKVDLGRLEDGLQIFQTSSPSYLLMASLEINAYILENYGKELFSQWMENVEWFLEEANKIKEVEVLRCPGLDTTKLNIRMKAGNKMVNGQWLERKLREKDVYLELYSHDMAMALTGIGNETADYKKLINALKGIVKEAGDVSKNYGSEGALEINHGPEGCSPKGGELEGSFMPKVTELVMLEEAIGQVCGQSLVPYPPGIPVISVGQTYTSEILEEMYALRKKGMKVLGMTIDGRVYVGTDIPK